MDRRKLQRRFVILILVQQIRRTEKETLLGQKHFQKQKMSRCFQNIFHECIMIENCFSIISV